MNCKFVDMFPKYKFGKAKVTPSHAGKGAVHGQQANVVLMFYASELQPSMTDRYDIFELFLPSTVTICIWITNISDELQLRCVLEAPVDYLSKWQSPNEHWYLHFIAKSVKNVSDFSFQFECLHSLDVIHLTYWIF